MATRLDEKALTPVAFFAYNRPEHTKRALHALAQCHKFDECEFYLFSDGPRTEAAIPSVIETRRILQEWAVNHKARVIEQTKNLGLAKSIVTGVTDLCQRYGRVVVVEDDLVVSPDFLAFMIEALGRYHADERVMQVGGFTISAPPNLGEDAFSLPVTTTWGWATWARAWAYFSWQPEDCEIAKHDEEWKKLFNLNGAGPYSSMLEDRLTGKNDSWGILWWYAVSRKRGLVVYPAQSLVWNGGFDGSGIHCGSGDFLEQGDMSRYLQASSGKTVRFPDEIGFKESHLLHLERFLLSRQTKVEDSSPSGFAGKLRGVTKRWKELLRHGFA